VSPADPEPYYRPLDGPHGERFSATAATVGPWFADAQHVGPPSALLARAVERCEPRAGTAVSRLTVEVLGPVPAGEVEVSARVERPGRAIELVAAEMRAGGRAVLRARAWRLAGGDTAEVAVGAAPRLPGPHGLAESEPDMPGWLPGFIDSVEWRFVHGFFTEPGPGATWIRQRGCLVEGEEPTPLQRLAVVADCANGAAAPLDIRDWLFVNTDLTLHLHRAPEGEWMAVDAATTVGPGGVGAVAGLLFDERGQVGRSAQSLVVRPR
jgi:acyl-Coa thioesterase superfamily protein/acyl-CoA thioesterase superfamily protein